MTVHLVSHFHWDREWYRTMQGFRARLVDAIDEVLRLAEDDDDFRFVLDGQTILIDDYLTVRPDRRDELVDRVVRGQLAVGPWFVQPDSLLPSGEAHIRNLLAGRRDARSLGPISSTAYVPDSFGHPAQFPQIFAGFGLDGFVYWRGNGDELEDLGPRWRWRSPDGSSVRALHLTEGYFNAARLPLDDDEAVSGLAELVRRLRAAGEVPVLLMNGFDHTRPDGHVSPLVGPLAENLGATVERSLLDDVVADCPTDQPEFTGELVSGRHANLLAGVWSARLPLKIRNRRCEVLLERWAEPWATLGQVLGLPGEGAALRTAWRSLLANQAHDSICGCSTDAVHDRMAARYDDSEGLASETLSRSLERLAGRNRDRDVPDLADMEVAVFNPSPHARTELVRIPLDGHPALPISLGSPSLHPLVEAGLSDIGFELEGEPVRTIAADDPDRVRWLPDQRVFDIEFVAHDVPAFGCRRYRLEQSEPLEERVDAGSAIEVDDLRVEVEPAGTLAVTMGDGRWEGLFGVEDVGDRGDSYDFESVGEERILQPTTMSVCRIVHPSGVRRLRVERVFAVAASLDSTRESRSSEMVEVTVGVDIVIGPGVGHAQGELRVDNRARDHRLRVLFPTGEAARVFTAGTTFDVVERSTTVRESSNWVHPAPTTICQQGFVAANGLGIVAPGLPEAEVTPDGVIHITLVRSVGWLARYDLPDRPIPAGPAMEVCGAQTLEPVVASFALTKNPSAPESANIHCGLRGVVAGPEPLLGSGRSLLEIDDDQVVLSALKPADDDDGIILRLSNPGEETRQITVRFGFEVRSVESVRLDETAFEREDRPGEISLDGQSAHVEIGRHALATLRIRPS